MGHTASFRVRAFSLVELVGVVAILAILVMLLLPMAGTLKDIARKVACRNNLRQLTAALLVYGQQNRNRVPMQLVRQVPATNMLSQYNTYGYYASATNPVGVLGLGRVATEQELPPKSLYCPQNTHPSWLLSGNLADDGSFYPLNRSDGTCNLGYSLRATVASNQEVPMATVSSASYAMVMDIAFTRYAMKFQHRTGTNVAYGDGHGQWVPWSAIASAYGGLPYNSTGTTYNPAMTTYFAALDAQAQ